MLRSEEARGLPAGREADALSAAGSSAILLYSVVDSGLVADIAVNQVLRASRLAALLHHQQRNHRELGTMKIVRALPTMEVREDR